ncbi:MAG: cobalt ECF transporter T component CbiQ [Chloroflexi bacterium]|nr:cobalt ECF transporter T component CbiQ [Chloroflexota bacterium]
MKSALASSLRHISERLEQSFTVEEYSNKHGLLQRLDARVKCITILLLIISVSFIHQPAVLLGGYIFALVLALVSAISPRFFITRIWLPLPMLTAVISIPALFMTPGQPLFALPFGLIVTRSGALTTALLYLRVGTSVSLALLLMLTTSWANLLRALAVMRVPDVVVLLLGMTYRYIYVLLGMTNDMLLSRYSRTVGKATAHQERAAEGAIVGTLLVRSLDMSSEVYLAMRSRGFTGYAHTLHTGRIGWLDYGWIALVVVLGVLSIFILS